MSSVKRINPLKQKVIAAPSMGMKLWEIKQNASIMKRIAIISTSKGLMTDKEAREAGLGGEVLAYIW